MKKILESKTKIRFQDCDPFNHLNNAKYIDYFINAREDQVLENYDFNIVKHTQNHGKGWVITSNQLVYVKPANIMEEVTIESQLFSFTESSIFVEMKMWNAEKSVLKSIFWSKFTYFSIKDNKRANHPEDLTKLFTEVLLNIKENTFEERSLNLIKQSRLQKNFSL